MGFSQMSQYRLPCCCWWTASPQPLFVRHCDWSAVKVHRGPGTKRFALRPVSFRSVSVRCRTNGICMAAAIAFHSVCCQQRIYRIAVAFCRACIIDFSTFRWSFVGFWCFLCWAYRPLRPFHSLGPPTIPRPPNRSYPFRCVTCCCSAYERSPLNWPIHRVIMSTIG